MNTRFSTFPSVTSLICLLAAAYFVDCSESVASRMGYDLNAPDRKYTLPGELVEVSGIILLNDSTVACVQDERGIIYYYDLKKRSVTGRIAFGADGDYEDICLHDGWFYVLRSDGVVFRVNRDTPADSPKSYNLPVECLDNEGFCHSGRTNEFILAGKSANRNDPDPTNRSLFVLTFENDSFSLVRRVVIRGNDPAFAGTQHEIKAGEKKHPGQFNPSAVAVHPATGDIYVLSAKSRMLVVLDTAGAIKQAWPLSAALFNKPEGIAFYPDGGMMISNEGKKKGTLRGYLLFFNYNKKG